MAERTLSLGERKKVEEMLEKKGITYRESRDQIYLPEKQRKEVEDKVEKILQEEQHIGFELFDTNTWIKGEKELQMLEMRALKGQLERDISSFENIRDAIVILDVAPPKVFGNAKYQTKASVILTLEEETNLTISQLRAIAYHISGAVRALSPSHIAISDTTGKLYKAIQQEGDDLFFTDQEATQEALLVERMTKLLTKIIGKGNFHLHFQMAAQGNPSVVSLLIDQDAFDRADQEMLKQQLKTLLKQHDEEPLIALDFIQFKRQMGEKKKGQPVWPYMIFASLLLFVAFMFIFGRTKKLVRKKRRIDVDKLAHLIKDQDPKIIAILFSYLESEKAEELLFALPYSVQKKVALHIPGVSDDEK